MSIESFVLRFGVAGHWDAVAHDNGVFLHNDFFDQEAGDFLFVGDSDVSSRLFEVPQKRLKRLIKLAELFIG